MTSVYSGGLVYEYTEEDNEYGLIELSPNGLRQLPDFDTLAEKFKATPAPRGEGGFKEDLGASECPEQTDSWAVDPSILPAMPEPAQRFFDRGAGKGPGLAGTGSQNAGTPSTTEIEAGSASEDNEGSDNPNAAGSVRVSAFGIAITIAATLIGAAAF